MEAGADVYLLDIDEEKGEKTAQSLRGEGGRATFFFCDVTDPRSVEDTFGRISSEVGGIDILVNNAGGWTNAHSLAETSDEEWDRLLDLNLKSVFLCSKAAIPIFRRQGSGRIINMGALSGLTFLGPSSVPYAAAKAGVHSLTRALAFELGNVGVTVNALAPATTATDRVSALRTEEQQAKIAASMPLGRIAEVKDMVGWVLFLSSSEASYLTDQTISMNGGRLMV